MNHIQRVLTALNLKIPDKVPYIECDVDEGFGIKLLGRSEPIYKSNNICIDSFGFGSFGFIGCDYFNPVEICEKIKLDAWGFNFFIDFLSEKKEVMTTEGPRSYTVGGLIKNKDDLKKLKFPDLNDDRIFEYINNYISKYKKDYAVFVFTNLGTDPLHLSMDWKTLAYAMIDDISLIEELLDLYNEWAIKAVKKLCQLDFDFIWFGDDIAYKNGLMFSPDFYRNICMPRLERVASVCTKPWIYHSDGNYLEIIEDLLSLGVKGLHPLEQQSVDIFDFKKNYVNKVCAIGNIDINTLSKGYKEEVYEEVKNKVTRLSKNGGYIMSSSNSITSYCKVENVLAMIEAFEEFRNYKNT